MKKNIFLSRKTIIINFLKNQTNKKSKFMTQSINGTKSMMVSSLDAAVAVSACLGVVYPHMPGLGGDPFFLAYI
ncbi:gamma-glutamyltransferase [Peribacillus simplex]|uniref:gamma-glutamyltransferase n=1 Tax=Peribacillus simplex TaxID=1478 RepID=UPI003D270F66